MPRPDGPATRRRGPFEATAAATAAEAAAANPAAIDHVIYQSWVRFYNDRCDQLLDMALTNNDSLLARKVSRLYKTEIVTRFAPDTVRGPKYDIATVTYDDSRRANAARRIAEMHSSTIFRTN